MDSSYIHVGGLLNENDEDPSCIEQLKNWILEKKLEYNKKYIQTQSNSRENLKVYQEELEKLGKSLIKAFEKDPFDEKILEANGWPRELIECMKDSEVFIPVIDSIQVSFISFPNTPSLEHAQVLNIEMKNTRTE